MAWGRAESFYLLNTKELLYVRDEKASGTNAGTFTGGAWRTRTLNTAVVNTITGASLASNQITLPAGTYWVEGRAPAIGTDEHKLILYNITDSAVSLIGSSEYLNSTTVQQGIGTVRGLVTIAAQKVFELQHRCKTTKTTDGLGVQAGTNAGGLTEVFAEVVIWKVN